MKYSRNFNQDDMDVLIKEFLIITGSVLLLIFGLLFMMKMGERNEEVVAEVVVEETIAPVKERGLTESEKEELAQYGKGDYVRIGWWGHSHIAPDGNSTVGQIRKIDGNRIYGSWGEAVLEYPNCSMQLISRKELLQTRQKEQLERDRKKMYEKKHRKWVYSASEEEKEFWKKTTGEDLNEWIARH